MSTPQLNLVPRSADHTTSDVLVLGVIQDGDEPQLPEGTANAEEIAGILAAVGATGARDELIRIPGTAATAPGVALVGLGPGEPTTESLRLAAGTASRRITGITTLEFALPARNDLHLLAILEGAALGAYSYTEYRSSSDAAKKPATSLVVRGDSDAAEELVTRALNVAEAIRSVKTLVNMPPDALYPESFATIAQQRAEELGLEVTVFAEDELTAGGFGGILGVGRGSARGPRMVRIDYHPPGATHHLALVGKGITFDSGGLSLKPAASMVGMKYDMTGAATVMETVFAASRLGLNLHVSAWLCLAENMPSSSAMRPNDVLTIRGGKTVEVLNTDAEGRLVLADGLVAASETQPDTIIDVATLTGAAIVALGSRYVGMMGDRDLLTRVAASADSVDEPFWAMPLPDELKSALSSDVADLANARIGNSAGGMLLAGVFLREFVGRRGDEPANTIPWAHLDIAGPANNTGSPFGFTGKGPSGVTVRTLLHLAEELSHA